MGKDKKRKGRFGGAISSDANKRKNKTSSYGYLNLPKGLKVFKESKGRLKLDFIPYIVSIDDHPDKEADVPTSAHNGNPWYKKPILVHRNIGVDNETLICPKTVGKKCPVCEKREEQLAEGVDWKEAIGKNSLRHLYLVVPKDNKDFEEEVHLWNISHAMFQKELDEELLESDEHDEFPDPEYGEIVSARFNEEKLGKNKFFKGGSIKFEERDKQYPESIMEKSPNLDEIFTVLSYKDLESKFLELGEDEQGEDDLPWDDKGNEKKGRKKKSTKSKDEKDEKEEKTPKRKKDKSKKDKKECPEGFKFGEDWDDFDECDECPVNKACEKKHVKMSS